MVIPGKTVISRKYEVLERLGKGGMGEVFKVRHIGFRTHDICAIKTILPDLAENEAYVKRFKEEARKNHSLSNPQNPDENIVQVIDVDFDPALNLHYYVMEYIEGKTLNQILREQGTLPLPDVLEIAEKVGRALAKAHNLPKPMIHRDISPSNIMIEDQSRRVVVMDFGIAKEVGEDTIGAIGKPKYCSPEQMGHKPLDGAADIYSLGMVVYELYTGKQFFAGLTADKVMELVSYDPTENLPHFDSSTPKEFVTLVTRSIAKSRAQRYRRMEEFLWAVEMCRTGLSEDSMTGTVTIPLPDVDKEDPEERRRKRLEEELRLISLDLQGGARTAREQAEEEGANVLAAVLFQQGQAKEVEANLRLEDRNHSRAQESYAGAVALFTRASEAAQQAAEQARKEMETVKTEAERYRARTTQAARHFYTVGLMSEAQAREFLDNKRYQHAYEKCAEARRAFADARDVAHETLRGEAEAARQQTEAVKEAAREEGAEGLAAELFHQAEQREKQAAAALEQEEFTQTIQLYATARQQYGEARQHAHTERQQQLALTAQQRAQTARQHLEAQEKDYTVLPSYDLAAEAQRQGDARLAEHEYEEAVRAYEQARQGYEQAEQEARHVQKQRAARAHQHLQEIREQAAEAGSKERFAQRWTEADQFVARGAEREEREDFLQAQQWYEQAAQRFEQVRGAAEVQAARERAEAARLPVAKIEQELEPLKPWAGPQWQAAQECQAQAERAWQEQLYEEAAEQYQQVVQRYEEARREAESERQRQQAITARQQTQQAQTTAEQAGAPQDAQTLYQQAREIWQRGEQNLAKRQWEQAAAEFGQAQELFTKAQGQAQREQARQAAVATREAAREAQQAAAEGATLFPQHWQEVEALFQQAEEALAAERYDVAQATFTESTASFQQLVQAVREHQHRAVLRQEAKAAQARASEAQQAAIAEGAAELTPDAFQQAERSLQQAETLLLGEDFTAAQHGFVAAQQQYEVAQQQARQERRHRAVLAAREQTEAAQRQAVEEGAAGLAPVTYQQAVTAQQEGHQQLTAEAYEQATQQYTRARAGFVRALREARQERRRRRAAAREQAEATRQRIAEVKRHLQPLAQWWGATQRLATQQETTAEQEWQAEHYEQAAEQYAEALKAYEEALSEAQATHRAYLTAAEARMQAEQARQATETAQALQYTPELFKQADTTYRQGEQHFQAQAWEAAAGAFHQAQEFFTQAWQQADEAKEQARQAAEAARTAAGEAQQAAAEGTTLFPQRWQEAATLLQQAEHALGVEQYAAAQNGFTESAQFFRQLAQAVQDHKHRKELQQAAEAVKIQTEAAQRQALKDKAEQFAAEAFSRAEQYFQQAAAALQNDQFTQARVLFDTARQQYTEAQRQAQLAQRRRAALAAREQAEDAQRQAVDGRAPELAPQVYQQALSAHQWGSEHFAAEAHEQAVAQYNQARESFARARREAEQEQQRRRAVAREQAEASRQQIAEIRQQLQPLAQWWGKTKAQAEQQERVAEQVWQEEQYEQAAEQYETVWWAYEEALSEAQATHRAYLTATETRTQAEQARQAAAEAQASQYAVALFEGAITLHTQGEQQFQNERWSTAATAFTQARELFAQAQQQARTAKEQARQDAAAARERTAEACTQAEQADAQKRFSQEFAQAQQMTEQGQVCQERQEFAQALSFYEQATQRFIKLQQEAVLLAARERAETAQRHTTEAKQIPEPLKQWTGEKWQEAQRLEAAAERAWQEGDYGQAEEQYRQAAQLYTLARAEAEAARQRQQALDAQQQAAREQASAYDTEAQQYAASLYQQATDSQQRGEQSLTAQQWAPAETAFLQAQRLFARARENARRTKARRLAAEAREKALQTQQDAAAGAALFPKQTAEAAAVLMEANRAFAREAFTAAETGFARSAELFQEIQRAVVLRRQKEQAEQAQARARELHSKTLAAKGRQKRRADRVLTEGDHLFQQEHYSEAQEKYGEAAALFAAIQPKQKEDPVSVPARSRWFSVSVDLTFLKKFHVSFFVGIWRSFVSVVVQKFHVSFFVGIGSLAVIFGYSLYRSSGAFRSSLLLSPDRQEESAPKKKSDPLPSPRPEKENQAEVPVRPAEPDPQPPAPQPPPTTVQLPPGLQEQAPSVSPAEVESRSEQKTSQKENPQQQAAVTPPPPSSPPLREPPRLTQVTPSPPEREIFAEEGKSLNFAVEADSPQKDPLRYAWFLDGRKQQEGNKKTWTYKPDFEAAGEKPKEVKVEVTNAANLTDKKTWSVRVQDVDQPPRIAQFSPTVRSVEPKGNVLNFSVQATDPDKEDTRLVYIWSLDGQEVSRGDSKSWQLPTSLSDAPHQVRVSVEDRAGKSDQVAWNVTIKPPTPRIVDFRPREEKIRINTGEPLDFSVTAAVPGGSDDANKKLIYQWKINDAAPQRTETGSFRFAETKPGSYQLTAVVISPEGPQNAEKRWSIEVKFVPPIGLLMTKEDAMKWLEMYKQALEGKKAEALARLGAITPQDVEEMQRILNGYKSLQVSFTLKDIKIDPNENRATVSFTREDTYERKKILFSPQTIILEKDPDGQVRRK